MKENEQPEYITWPALTPSPVDAPMFRRLWAKLRRSRFVYSQRRALAHDYMVAKCCSKEEKQ